MNEIQIIEGATRLNRMSYTSVTLPRRVRIRTAHHQGAGLRCIECLREIYYDSNTRWLIPRGAPVSRLTQRKWRQTAYYHHARSTGPGVPYGRIPASERVGSPSSAVRWRKASVTGWNVPVIPRAPAYPVKTAPLRRTGDVSDHNVLNRRRYSLPCKGFSGIKTTVQKGMETSSKFGHLFGCEENQKYCDISSFHEKELTGKAYSLGNRSTNSMLLERQRIASSVNGKKSKSSLTPPPLQLHSTKVDDSLHHDTEFERTKQCIPIATETIVQLIAASENFGSVTSLRNSQKRGKPRRGIIASLSKAKLWKKPQIKKLGKAKHMGGEKIQPNINKPASPTKSKIAKKLTKTKSATSISYPKLPSSPHPIKSSISPRNSVFAKIESEPLTARLWEEFEEILSTTKSTEGFKDHRSSWYERQSDKRRRHSLAHDLRTYNDTKIEENLRLEDIIHEPQTLKTFLSIKYFAWSFRRFLQSEFSEENLDFWLECQDYKLQPLLKQKKIAPKIYEKYLKVDALREVNITLDIRKNIEDKVSDPDQELFEEAQNHIYELMNKDSYKRFLNSEIYENLTKALPNSSTARKRVFDFPEPSINKKSKH